MLLSSIRSVVSIRVLYADPSMKYPPASEAAMKSFKSMRAVKEKE